MSSDGGSGGGAGGFFDWGDAEFDAAQDTVGAIEGVATDALKEARTAKAGYWGRRNAATKALQSKYDFDKQTARGIAKDVQREADTVAVDVMGRKVRDQDLVMGVFDVIPGLSRLGETLAEEAWDRGWSVDDPDTGQGFDTGGLPDTPGVDAASPGPDFDVGATVPPPVVEDNTFDDGTTTTDPGPPTRPDPAVPAATPSGAVGTATSRARRRGRTETIATSTLGVPSTAPVTRRTLLGA